MPRKINIDMDALTAYISTHHGHEFGGAAIRAAASEFGVTYPTIMKRLDQYKVGYGKWNLSVQEQLEQTYNAPAAAPAVDESIVQNLIPAKDDSFVPFGNFSDVKKIISSGIFYPVFITGLSGNGKTFSVEQACAALGRELIRVTITI